MNNSKLFKEHKAQKNRNKKGINNWLQIIPISRDHDLEFEISMQNQIH